MIKNLLNGIEEVLLMGPGPSCISEEVYQALRKPTLGHMDKYFIGIMDAIKPYQQTLMNTSNALTIPISGTGSAGMETVFVNLIETGDPVLIIINGVFGNRMKEVVERLGGNVEVVEFDWGDAVDPNLIEDQLKKDNYKIVAMVHAETSTGVCNPAKQIGEILKKYESLYILDIVTSLGGMEVYLDDWGVDAAYSGTQKCLSVPPGLSPISFSDKALHVIKKRKTKVPNWYLDISLLSDYWEGEKRKYHHTAPVNMLYALYQSLYQIIEVEGLESVFSRHRNCHKKLVKELESLGFEMFVNEQNRLPMLNSVKIPKEINDINVRKVLRDEYRIEIGSGLGPLAGKIWRIGIMGYTAQEKFIDKLIFAMKDIFGK